MRRYIRVYSFFVIILCDLFVLSAVLTAYDLLRDNTPGKDDTEALATIRFDDEQQFRDEIAQLKGNITVKRAFSDRIEVIATQEYLDLLESMGYDVEVHLDDYREATRWIHDNRGKGHYHSHSELTGVLIDLSELYSHIAVLDTLGWSVENREILCMTISDNPGEMEPEPGVRIHGNVHGNEYIGCEVSLYLLRYLLENYDLDPYVTDLVNNRRIMIVPMVNPDGHEHNQRYNRNGVDLNRDFGYCWNEGYTSPGAFSQPETQAVRTIMEPGWNVFSIDYHSGTEGVLRPWAFHPDETVDMDNFIHVSGEYGSRSSYDTGQWWYFLYESHGPTQDFGYGSLGELSFTVEISYSYAPPEPQIEAYCERNLPAQLWFLEEAGKGLWGVVTDEVSQLPVEAKIDIEEVGWPVYTESTTGVFGRYLLPGTYTVRVSANRHETKIIENVEIVDGDPTFIQVSLGRRIAAHARQVSTCKIADPNNQHRNHTLTSWALGEPDGESLSMGKGGWIVFDMGEDTPVIDGSGRTRANRGQVRGSRWALVSGRRSSTSILRVSMWLGIFGLSMMTTEIRMILLRDTTSMPSRSTIRIPKSFSTCFPVKQPYLPEKRWSSALV
jgi:carboxypeptidase D